MTSGGDNATTMTTSRGTMDDGDNKWRDNDHISPDPDFLLIYEGVGEVIVKGRSRRSVLMLPLKCLAAMLAGLKNLLCLGRYVGADGAPV